MSGVAINFESRGADAAERALKKINNQLSNVVRNSISTSGSIKNINAKSLKNIDKAAKKTSMSFKNLGIASKNAFKKVGAETKYAIQEMTSLKGVIVGTASAFAVLSSVRLFNKASDDLVSVQNKLKLVIKDSEKLQRVQGKIFSLSRETRSGFSSTADMYVKLTKGLEKYGISQKRVLGMVRTIKEATTLSSGSEASKEAGLIQLGQGLTSQLRGQELRSVFEQLDYLGLALQKHFGKTTGELIKFAETGALSGRTLVRTFESIAKATDKDFKYSSFTVASSMAMMSASLSLFFGKLNRTLGIADKFSKIFLKIADTVTAYSEKIINTVAAFRDNFNSILDHLSLSHILHIGVTGIVHFALAPFTSNQKKEQVNKIRANIHSFEKALNKQHTITVKSQVKDVVVQSDTQKAFKKLGNVTVFKKQLKDISIFRKAINALYATARFIYNELVLILYKIGKVFPNFFAVAYKYLSIFKTYMLRMKDAFVFSFKFDASKLSSGIDFVKHKIDNFMSSLHGLKFKINWSKYIDKKGLDTVIKGISSFGDILTFVASIKYRKVSTKFIDILIESFKVGIDKIKSFKDYLISLKDIKMSAVLNSMNKLGDIFKSFYEVNIKKYILKVVGGVKAGAIFFIKVFKGIFNKEMGLAIKSKINSILESMIGSRTLLLLQNKISTLFDNIRYSKFFNFFVKGFRRVITYIDKLKRKLVGIAMKRSIYSAIDSVTKPTTTKKNKVTFKVVGYKTETARFKHDTESNFKTIGDAANSLFTGLINSVSKYASIFGKKLKTAFSNLISMDWSAFFKKLNKELVTGFVGAVALFFGAGSVIPAIAATYFIVKFNQLLNGALANMIPTVLSFLGGLAKTVGETLYDSFLNAFSSIVAIMPKLFQSVGKAALSVFDNLTGISTFIDGDAILRSVKHVLTILPTLEKARLAWMAGFGTELTLLTTLFTNKALHAIILVGVAMAALSKKFRGGLFTMLFGKNSKYGTKRANGIIDYIYAMLPRKSIITGLFDSKLLGVAAVGAMSTAMLKSVSVAEASMIATPLMLFALLGKDGGGAVIREVFKFVNKINWGVLRMMNNIFSFTVAPTATFVSGFFADIRDGIVGGLRMLKMSKTADMVLKLLTPSKGSLLKSSNRTLNNLKAAFWNLKKNGPNILKNDMSFFDAISTVNVFDKDGILDPSKTKRSFTKKNMFPAYETLMDAPLKSLTTGKLTTFRKRLADYRKAYMKHAVKFQALLNKSFIVPSIAIGSLSALWVIFDKGTNSMDKLGNATDDFVNKFMKISAIVGVATLVRSAIKSFIKYKEYYTSMGVGGVQAAKWAIGHMYDDVKDAVIGKGRSFKDLFKNMFTLDNLTGKSSANSIGKSFSNMFSKIGVKVMAANDAIYYFSKGVKDNIQAAFSVSGDAVKKFWKALREFDFKNIISSVRNLTLNFGGLKVASLNAGEALKNLLKAGLFNSLSLIGSLVSFLLRSIGILITTVLDAITSILITLAPFAVVGMLGVAIFGKGNDFIEKLQWTYDKIKSIIGLEPTGQVARIDKLQENLKPTTIKGIKLDFSKLLNNINAKAFTPEQMSLQSSVAESTHSLVTSMKRKILETGNLSDKDMSKIKAQKKIQIHALKQATTLPTIDDKIKKTNEPPTDIIGLFMAKSGFDKDIAKGVNKVSKTADKVTTEKVLKGIDKVTLGGAKAYREMDVKNKQFLAGIDKNVFKAIARFWKKLFSVNLSDTVPGLTKRIKATDTPMYTKYENTVPPFFTDEIEKAKNKIQKIVAKLKEVGKRIQSEHGDDYVLDQNKQYKKLKKSIDPIISRIHTLKVMGSIPAKLRQKFIDMNYEITQTTGDIQSITGVSVTKGFFADKDTLKKAEAIIAEIKKKTLQLADDYNSIPNNAARIQVTLDKKRLEAELKALVANVQTKVSVKAAVESQGSLFDGFISKDGLKRFYLADGLLTKDRKESKELIKTAGDLSSTISGVDTLSATLKPEELKNALLYINKQKQKLFDKVGGSTWLDDINIKLKKLGSTKIKPDQFMLASEADIRSLSNALNDVIDASFRLDALPDTSFDDRIANLEQYFQLLKISEAKRSEIFSNTANNIAKSDRSAIEKNLLMNTLTGDKFKGNTKIDKDFLNNRVKLIAKQAELITQLKEIASTDINIPELGIQIDQKKYIDVYNKLVDLKKEIDKITQKPVFSMNNLLDTISKSGVKISENVLPDISKPAEIALVNAGKKYTVLSNKISRLDVTDKNTDKLNSSIKKRSGLLRKIASIVLNSMKDSNFNILDTLKTFDIKNQKDIETVINSNLSKTLSGAYRVITFLNMLNKTNVGGAKEITKRALLIERIKKNVKLLKDTKLGKLTDKLNNINNAFNTNLDIFGFAEMPAKARKAFTGVAAQANMLRSLISDGLVPDSEISSFMSSLKRLMSKGNMLTLFANMHSAIADIMEGGIKSGYDRMKAILKSMSLSDYLSIDKKTREDTLSSFEKTDKLRKLMMMPLSDKQVDIVRGGYSVDETLKKLESSLSTEATKTKPVVKLAKMDTLISAIDRLTKTIAKTLPKDNNKASTVGKTLSKVNSKSSAVDKGVLTVSNDLVKDTKISKPSGGLYKKPTKYLNNSDFEKLNQIDVARKLAFIDKQVKLSSKLSAKIDLFDLPKIRKSTLNLFDNSDYAVTMKLTDELISKKEALRIASRNNDTKAVADIQKRIIELKYALNEIPKAIEETALAVIKAGESFGKSAKSNFSNALSGALKGETDGDQTIIGTFISRFAQSFSNSVIDNFSKGITDSLFGNDAQKGLLGIFSTLGSNIYSLLSKGLSGISGAFSGDGVFSGIGKLFSFFATGGDVSGAGTGTSDSIPAMLSDGEFVVNAKSTKRFRPLLSAINSGSFAHFSDGGAVGSTSQKVADNRTFAESIAGSVSSLSDGVKAGFENVNDTFGIVTRNVDKNFMSVSRAIENTNHNVMMAATSAADSSFNWVSAGLTILGAITGAAKGVGSGVVKGIMSGTSKVGDFSSGLAAGLKYSATGGYISGPGTGTSDSIAAMLSNGEFVVNAKATKKFAPLLNAINSNGLPAFALGGPVGGSLSSVKPTSRNNSQVVNINITGDISRQTRKEIYSMLPTITSGVNSVNKENGYKG